MSSSSLSTLNSQLSTAPGPIGIFDSGYGGLTILHGIRQLLPEYDYLYLGDNARTPYGPRSFEVVYEFTRQAVMKLFEMGCHLIILGCNTASAKALRTIQQNDIPQIDPERRVLGVIRPTAEVIGELTQSRHVGVLATEKSRNFTPTFRSQVSPVPSGCRLWNTMRPTHLVPTISSRSASTRSCVSTLRSTPSSSAAPTIRYSCPRS